MLPDNDPYDGFDVPADYKPNCLECPLFEGCDLPGKFVKLAATHLLNVAINSKDDHPFNTEDEINRWLDTLEVASEDGHKLINLMRFIAFDTARKG